MIKISKTMSAGILLTSVVILLTGVFVAGMDSQTGQGPQFHGMVTITQYDVLGNTVFTQTAHNQLVDSGEQFILQASFSEGSTSLDDADQIASICVTDTVTVNVGESVIAADFDSDNTLTTNNCIKDDVVDVTVPGTAVIGPLTFEAETGGNHFPTSTTITGIGICQGRSASEDFNNCATSGILFAVIDTSDITLLSGETVDVTYTFNIASPST